MDIILANTDIELYQLTYDNESSYEKDYVDFWQGYKSLYHRMSEKNKHNPPFVSDDGPPFVSGSLHCGHIVPTSVKSAINNFMSMNGYNCAFKLGYDCHGLPIENLVCRENELDTLEKITDIGLNSFNTLCDQTITRYATSWTPIFQRIGRLADFDKVYMTRDVNFMETCIWIFKELWKKNLVYKANKVMQYSYGNQTPLSNFEASQNYQEKETKSVYVGFEITDDFLTNTKGKNFFVAWTTTPWTLPTNMALCVNSDIVYVHIKLNEEMSGNTYILGENTVTNVFGKKPVTVLQKFKGSELVGMKYKPLFPFVQAIDNLQGLNIREYKIVSDPYVKNDANTGTSIVHLSPAFGDDDFKVCEANNIVNNINVSHYCPIDANGKFLDIIEPYKGMLVFDAEDTIRQDLKKMGHLFKTELIKHSYPYCWRTDTPLINRTTDSYYIKVTALKDRMVELNKTVNWYPEEIGKNRFHNWLANAKDWAVSRSRFYGTPLPIWVNITDPNDMICIGSIKELEELSGIKVNNLHPEFVNDITIIKDGNTYRRIKDIFDCWFESGAVPMAQLHYPFDEASHVLHQREYLSDFICEGLDQTRGWFYTLLVLSTAIFDKAPYRNVICTGLVLDANGVKMSKKLGNFVDPRELIDEFGADTVRVYFLSSPVMHAEPLKFNTTAIRQLKYRFSPYINGVKFWIEHTINYMKKKHITHINIERINSPIGLNNIMDRWIINRTNQLVKQTHESMKKYQFNIVTSRLLDFIEDLTNWYIKFNRDRIKGNEGIEEQFVSISVLYNVLVTYCKLWAPFTPFMSEHIFQHLKKCSSEYKDNASVLLSDYPKYLPENNEQEDEIKMFADLQKICSMVRNLRKTTKTHNKDIVPLKTCTIYNESSEYLTQLEKYIHVIVPELNCCNVEFNKLSDNMTIKIEIDQKSIGQFFRREASSVTKYLMGMPEEVLMNVYRKLDTITYNSGQYNEILNEQFYKLVCVPKLSATCSKENPETLASLIDGDIMVSINHVYDTNIHKLYQVKRLHIAVQNARKKMGLRPWQRVIVTLDNIYANQDIRTMLETSLTNVNVVIDTFVDNDEFINGDTEIMSTYVSQYGQEILDYKTFFIWDAFNDIPNIMGKIFVSYIRD
jgi:isoleucyl-tRNA synthetase